MNKPTELTIKANMDTSDVQRKLRIAARHFELLAKELEEEEKYEVTTDLRRNIFGSPEVFDIVKEINRALENMRCPRSNKY